MFLKSITNPLNVLYGPLSFPWNFPINNIFLFISTSIFDQVRTYCILRMF